MAEENEDEEREDVLARRRGEADCEGAWSGARAGAGPHSGPQTGPSGCESDRAPGPLCSVTTEKRGAVVSSGLRSERSKSGEAPKGRTAFVQPESLGRAANRRSVTTGEVTSEQPELMAGELWKDGPVWTARGGAAGLTPEDMRRSGAAQTGLEGLYRQTVQGLRPAVPALPPEQVGKPVRAQEPGSAASLAVDELDRAVRRDSRRYDGGMSIF